MHVVILSASGGSFWFDSSLAVCMSCPTTGCINSCVGDCLFCLFVFQLEKLEIGWCDDLSDQVFPLIFRRCLKLRKLISRKVRVTAPTLLQLTHGPPLALTHLDLDDSTGVLSDEHFPSFAQALLHVEYLDISWNIKITNFAIDHILTHCRSLQYLYLKGVKRLTIEAFLPIITIWLIQKEGCFLWELPIPLVVKHWEPLSRSQEVSQCTKLISTIMYCDQ